MFQDAAISTWIYENISSPFIWIGYIAKFLSNINSWGQMWICILIGLIVYNSIKAKKFKSYYLLTIVPILLGWCFCEYYLKNAIGRIRPYQELDFFKTYMDSISYKYPSGNSFPSGHTLIAFAAAFVLSSQEKKYIPFAYVLASLIAFSRILLGAHYLSDVIAGMGIGTILGGLGILFSSKLHEKFDSLIVKLINKTRNKK